MLETRNSRFRKMKGRRARDLTYDDLLQIVHLIQSSSRFSEFRLRAGEIEVEIRRANGAPAPAASMSDRRPGEPVGGEVTLEPASAALHVPHAQSGPGELPAGTVVVRAPMVGTFYRAPEPGAAPFVEAGQHVTADTTVCIIEVMKLMNSIPAGCTGVVTHVLVKDAEPVEYGQPLIAIRPDA
jgi:acetyl-CoA carboxylase biotin carboxyl carrier protein